MLTSGRKKSVQDAPTANDHDCNGCKANQAHTDTHPTKSEWDSSNAKLAKRSYGKGGSARRGIVWVWKVNVSAVALIHSRNY